MLRILGLRAISKNESCHCLILGTPMVSCSHMLTTSNLKNAKVRRIILAGIYNTDEISESNKIPKDRPKDGEVEISNTLEKKN